LRTVLMMVCILMFSIHESQAQARPGLRSLGIKIGSMPPGALNAITDVAGVRVGHCTLVRGDSIRTGVTAVLPHPGNLFLEKVPAAVEVFNGFGKLAGSTQVNELGLLETPVLLTNTLSVPAAAQALIRHMLALPGMEEVYSINPLVAETNDHYLNDIRAMAVGADEVETALAAASGGPVTQGSVGAGTGVRCLGFKGGIGTSSRAVNTEDGVWTVGALAQTNFGGRLTIDGVPAGKLLERESAEHDGSCVIVLATDAPLTHESLRRLARRAFAGMARTGADFSNGSGDYAIAFSTHPALRQGRGVMKGILPVRPLDGGELDPLFQAAAEAAEEAIISSLTAAATVSGWRGHRVEAIDPESLRKLFRKR